MELGGDIEVSAENERLGARSRYEQLHAVVPCPPAIEAAFSAAVGHVNAEELKHEVRRRAKEGEKKIMFGRTSKLSNSQDITRPCMMWLMSLRAQHLRFHVRPNLRMVFGCRLLHIQ